MGFLNSLKSLFSGGEQPDEAVYWIYARCHRCGEVIRTRIDLINNLSPLDEGGYTVHKTLVGSQRYFERIEVRLIFDEGRRLVEREISRGDFITREEFEAAGNS